MSISGEELKYIHSEDIDVKDNSGIIAFNEIEKKQKWQEKIKPLISQIEDLEIEDWAELFLYANNKIMLKTYLQKALFLFTMRSGLSIHMFGWQSDNYGPYSRDVEEVVSNSEDIKKRTVTGKHGIMYKYELKKEKEVEKMWTILPSAVKDLIKEINKEFKGLRTADKLGEFIHSAYPKFAINAI